MSAITGSMKTPSQESNYTQSSINSCWEFVKSIIAIPIALFHAAVYQLQKNLGTADDTWLTTTFPSMQEKDVQQISPSSEGAALLAEANQLRSRVTRVSERVARISDKGIRRNEQLLADLRQFSNTLEIASPFLIRAALSHRQPPNRPDLRGG